MFKISYKFSKNTDHFIKEPDEADLRYNLFLGSLILKNGEEAIIIDWDWIPLFDFALCLISLCDNLLIKEVEKLELDFTESDEKLIFHKDDKCIKISATFSNVILTVSFENFQMGSRVFFKEIISEILKRNIELESNELFIKYINMAKKM